VNDEGSEGGEEKLSEMSYTNGKLDLVSRIAALVAVSDSTLLPLLLAEVSPKS
jgi:hypothetical protein